MWLNPTYKPKGNCQQLQDVKAKTETVIKSVILNDLSLCILQHLQTTICFSEQHYT